MLYRVYVIVIYGCMNVSNMVNILYEDAAIIVCIGYVVVCVVMILTLSQIIIIIALLSEWNFWFDV